MYTTNNSFETATSFFTRLAFRNRYCCIGNSSFVIMIVTITAGRATAKQAQESLKRQTWDSEQRTRPYVSVDIVPSIVGAPNFDIVIKNLGKSTARTISLKLATDDFQTKTKYDLVGSALEKLFNSTFALSPQASRRFFWICPKNKDDSSSEHQGTPISAEIVTTYTWKTEDERGIREYKETLQYDVSHELKIAPQVKSGLTSEDSKSDSNTQIKNLDHALRAIGEKIVITRRG